MSSGCAPSGVVRAVKTRVKETISEAIRIMREMEREAQYPTRSEQVVRGGKEDRPQEEKCVDRGLDENATTLPNIFFPEPAKEVELKWKIVSVQELRGDEPGVLIELCVHFTHGGREKNVSFKVECPNFEPRRVDFGKGWQSI